MHFARVHNEMEREKILTNPSRDMHHEIYFWMGKIALS